MKKVVITKKLPSSVELYLEGFRIEMNMTEETLPFLRLRQMASDADGIITSSADTIDKIFMDSAPKLKVIANYSTNCSNIDVEYAHKKGITVCTAGTALPQNAAEMIFALLMSAAKHIPYEDITSRNDNQEGCGNKKTFDFYKKTIGIIGMDMVGQAIAKISSGFSMDVIYNDVQRNHSAEFLLSATNASLDEVLEWSDFIVISNIFDNVLNGKINLSHFRRMKRSVVLVCLSSGVVFEMKDLITALKDNLIGGAALNLSDFNSDEVISLKGLSNTVLITKDRGGSAQRTQVEMAHICAEAVASVLNEGVTPATAITI